MTRARIFERGLYVMFHLIGESKWHSNSILKCQAFVQSRSVMGSFNDFVTRAMS